MNRLGIDWGEKRWGLSFSDEVNIATPIPAIVQDVLEEKWNALLELVKLRRISEIVVGYPYNMDGSVGFKAKEVDGFIDELSNRCPDIKIVRVDERLTSSNAGANWNEKKKRKERKSGKLDSQSAALILQDYLDQQEYNHADLLMPDPPFDD